MKRQYKKYPNRRLYDVERSCYVNIDDIKKHVLAFVEIEVMDVKTHEDITTSILLQILNQQDARDSNKIITAQTLANLIRLYEHPLGAAMSSSLEAMMAWFGQRVDATQDANQMWTPNIQQQYMDVWQKAWSAFLPTTSPPNESQNNRKAE